MNLNSNPLVSCLVVFRATSSFFSCNYVRKAKNKWRNSSKIIVENSSKFHPLVSCAHFSTIIGEVENWSKFHPPRFRSGE